jgi:hypothetical protein
VGVYWERTGYWSGELDRALSRAPKRAIGCRSTPLSRPAPRWRPQRGCSDAYGHAPARQNRPKPGGLGLRTDRFAAAVGGLE